MKKLIKDLLPFWIYVGCITMFWLSYLALPNLVIVFFIYYPFLLFGEFAVGYLIGCSLQQRTETRTIRKRMGIATLCPFILVSIFPILLTFYKYLQWGEFSVKEFFKTYENFETRIMAVETFVSIWLGEEISKNVYENQEEKQ